MSEPAGMVADCVCVWERERANRQRAYKHLFGWVASVEGMHKQDIVVYTFTRVYAWTCVCGNNDTKVEVRECGYSDNLIAGNTTLIFYKYM